MDICVCAFSLSACVCGCRHAPDPPVGLSLCTVHNSSMLAVPHISVSASDGQPFLDMAGHAADNAMLGVDERLRTEHRTTVLQPLRAKAQQ